MDVFTCEDLAIILWDKNEKAFITLNPGNNLDGSCGIIVEPGEDEGTNIVLPELEPIIINGRLISIRVIKEGFGFTTLPKIYVGCTNRDISDGDQRRAIIKPVLRYVPRKDAKKY